MPWEQSLVGSSPTTGTIIMPKSKLPDINFRWNSRIAYAIGLITTDGSLSKDGRHIILVSTDYQLLEDFQKCLPFDTKITFKARSGFSKKQPFKVQFGNVQFYRWLVKLGLYPNKTRTIGPICVPDKYFRDFLRGHLDGDGDVVTYTDYYNTYKNRKYIYKRLYARFCSASKNHIVWIRDQIKNLLGIKGSLTHFLRNDRTIPQWRLRFAKKESIKLYYWMYYSPNVLCLERKRRKFKEFLRICLLR